MPEVERTVTVDQPVSTVWPFIKEFRTTQQWDPPTVRTDRTSGDGGVGTTYLNVSSFLGKETEVSYVVTDCVEEKRLQLAGDAGNSLTLLDTITLEPTLEGGTALTYHAEFTLHGAAKLTTPLMPPALKVLADSVADQLERTLTEL